MKTIKGQIDIRHGNIVRAMAERDGALLPKTVAAANGRPLVVIEVRK